MSTNIKIATTQEKVSAQVKYCNETNQPFFAPSGKCWSCGSVIWNRISIQQAASSLVTGCPFCHTSFCE